MTTTWKGYASSPTDEFGRYINLYLASEYEGVERMRVQQVTRIDATGTVVKVVDRDENTQPVNLLRVEMEVAEAMYQALHRLFGQQQDDPKTVLDALNHERARVDRVLSHLLDRN